MWSLHSLLLSRCSLPHLPWRHPASKPPAEQPCHPPHGGLPLAAQRRNASASVRLSACTQHPVHGVKSCVQFSRAAAPFEHRISSRVWWSFLYTQCWHCRISIAPARSQASNGQVKHLMESACDLWWIPAMHQPSPPAQPHAADEAATV